MKLTIDNYFDQVRQYQEIITGHGDLKASHDFLEKATDGGKDFSNYENSPSIKEMIDLYLEKLNGLMAREKKPARAPHKTAAKPAATKKATEKSKEDKPVIKPTAKKKEKTKPETVAEKVEHIPSDIALIKRYISLHDKDKTYDQVLSIWRAFNKSVVERKVTKDSPYRSEIATMNSTLKSALEEARSMGSLHLTISASKLKTFKAIAESVEKSTGTSILLEFINISGKTGMKERADKLVKRISKAMEAGKLTGDRYLKDIKQALTAIEAYLNSETDVVTLNHYALSGIGEIAVFGCPCDKELAGFTRSQNAVIYKLIQEKVKNLQDCELDRAFGDTVAPSLCKTIAHKLIETRQLTMSLLRNPAKVSGSLALNGSGRGRQYDFGTEIMDMRLRNAGSRSVAAGKSHKDSGLSGTDNVIPFHSGTEEVRIISASELVKKKFATMGLTGKYRKLIGDPEPGFSAMIYGKPKEGKSTVAIDFAKELAKHGRVLYCAFEEGHGYTLQDKVIRNNADVPGLDFANKLPPFLSGYRYVFIDSVSDAGLDETAFKALIKSNKPQTSVLGIFHATKAGNFRGGQTYAHDVDILMRVEGGVVYTQGRYAPPTDMNISALLPAEVKQAA